MGTQLGTTLWTLTLFPGWEGETNADCTSASHPAGVGALQFSGYTKLDGTVSSEDLAETTVQDLPIGVAPVTVRLGEFEGLSCRYFESGTLWRRWYLRSGAILLFVTYNCKASAAGIEDEAVEVMLQSLRTSTPNAI